MGEAGRVVVKPDGRAAVADHRRRQAAIGARRSDTSTGWQALPAVTRERQPG